MSEPEGQPLKSQVRYNAEKDPEYCPYCMRCSGFHRMEKVAPFLWRHRCGAVHDERKDSEKIVAGSKYWESLTGWVIAETSEYPGGPDVYDVLVRCIDPMPSGGAMTGRCFETSVRHLTAEKPTK